MRMTKLGERGVKDRAWVWKDYRVLAEQTVMLSNKGGHAGGTTDLRQKPGSVLGR